MSIANTSQATTNESKVRLIASFVFISAVIYLYSNQLFIPILLVVDFSLRSFDLGKHSPFAILSNRLIKAFRLPVKPVYLPPKRFAARIGLLFSIAILILHLSGISTVAATGVLIFFAALESFLSICAGCYVYSFLIQIKVIR